MSTTGVSVTMETANEEDPEETAKKIFASYMGISFSLFLAHLPSNSLWLVPNLQTQIKDLARRLFHSEEQLRQMKSRRIEDSKANARVVEIFASHRQAWQAEEKRLVQQIDEANEDIAHLRARVAELESREGMLKRRVEELEREVGEREEMIGFMTRRDGMDEVEEEGLGEGEYSGNGARNLGAASLNVGFHCDGSNGFSSDLLNSASKFWSQKASLWQDIKYEPVESLYHMKHFVPRRESPWKVDYENSGVSTKLKLLEQELLNVEKVGNGDLSKISSLLRKQAKRYQALAGKIDDLCRRMQASDPCEPSLSSEFRTQRQTEFLLEAFRLQQRSSETGQKLSALQTEISKSYHTEDLGSSVKLSTRRSLDSVRNNFKEIQRNLEIWLARIIGDMEGILAREGASSMRECHVSRYPFVQ